MGRAWHHISLDICRFRPYHLTRCSSFQRVSNHSIKEKERAAETFQYPVIIYVRFGPSSRCYMSELLFAIDGFLLLHQILATQHICRLDVVTVLFTFTLTLCSIFHLELIACESYVVIRKWKDYRVIVTKKRLKKQALIAWISATVSVWSPNLIIMAVGGQSTVATPAVATVASWCTLKFANKDSIKSSRSTR